jgi:predicted RNase H-like HicB family nuclease
MESIKYAVVIERSDGGFGVYVPDLPGCVAVGETEEEARQLIREAIELHLEALRDAGDPIPPPSSSVEYVNVPSAA